MWLFYYLQQDRQLKDLRLAKDACSSVWEETGKPTIVTNTGYWKSGEIECVVFENEEFRSLNDHEWDYYISAWETRAGVGMGDY